MVSALDCRRIGCDWSYICWYICLLHKKIHLVSLGCSFSIALQVQDHGLKPHSFHWISCAPFTVVFGSRSILVTQHSESREDCREWWEVVIVLFLLRVFSCCVPDNPVSLCQQSSGLSKKSCISPKLLWMLDGTLLWLDIIIYCLRYFFHTSLLSEIHHWSVVMCALTTHKCKTSKGESD